MSQTLASRTFTEADQIAFAELSGDFNPVHMDALVARRTQAGAAVVHGIHGILWALDRLAQLGIVTDDAVSLSVQFKKFVHLGQVVDLKLVRRDQKSIVAELALGALTATTLSIRLDTGRQVDDFVCDRTASAIAPAKEPANFVRLEDLAEISGWMDVSQVARGAENCFPHAVVALGGERTAAIALLSTLVGMVCPGLHSLFAGFSIALVDTPHARNGLKVCVSEIDDRFRIVRMNVVGAGLRGSVQAFMRWAPVVQAPIGEMAKTVSASEFAGSTVLIVGGSRGLGALTAKVLAAGGAEVIVTYVKGEKEAAELRAEIRSFVGREACQVLPYDARDKADKQLGSLGRTVDCLYYFATTPIAKQKTVPFAVDLLDEFLQVYVRGFYDCCRFVADQASRRLTIFYPSSVFVATTPPAMIEYVLAKRVGEMLCEDINRSLSSRMRVVVARLPRLLTDQTATVPPVAVEDSRQVMLPIIRQVQGAR